MSEPKDVYVEGSVWRDMRATLAALYSEAARDADTRRDLCNRMDALMHKAVEVAA